MCECWAERTNICIANYIIIHFNFTNRYYLEPASPLKSITNTAQLATVQKQQQQLNGTTPLTNGTGTKSIEENVNNLWASSHATTNGTELTNGRWKLDLLSSNDTNSSPFAKTNGTNGKPLNGFALNGTKTKTSSSISRPIQNGFHLPPPGSKATQQNGHANLFTPDSEFVADFSSANIFDALNQKPSINNINNNHTISTNKSIQLNGVAKHTLNGIDMSNGNGNQQMNGNGNGNGNNSFNDNGDENFADFEHNTIYNAAGEFANW